MSLRGRLRAAFPGMVSAWALGVIFLSVRFFLGWRSVESLRRSGTLPEDAAWTARFESLKARLKISRPVTMLVSATSAVPMVIGWFKPVVLVPAGLFLGLRAPQLEAILAHELAHIRRHDYLANLLQAVAETVLFYHPAVWWVSAQMRKEREHCCDDIGSSITGSALDYVRALTALEEIRGVASVPAGAVSAAGGSLLGRVRRLLGVAPREPGSAAPWVLGVVVVLVAALAFSGMKGARGGPAAAPDTAANNAADPRTAPVTDGTYMAQVLNVPGHEQVVILTKRAFTVSDDSTSRSGSITLPVNTSDKTLTIVYSWPEATPGVIDLKTGGYPVSRFDLSRGRVFFVHFEKLEFSADVFQVPAAVKVSAISSPESLTQAAERVAAWYAGADDRALWECSRVIVPEGEYQARTAPRRGSGEDRVGRAKRRRPAAGAGRPRAWGCRACRPAIAHQAVHPQRWHQRRSPSVRRRFSTKASMANSSAPATEQSFPTARAIDGKAFSSRVRLAPGHYIALESGPMRTFMAEKDGSSAGGMTMMDHGFTVLPGEYTLQLTHGIGQFLGRPVNFHFGDPRGAPGLGEWTGVLKSAPLPLRLVDQQIKTAKPGSSEAFGGPSAGATRSISKKAPSSCGTTTGIRTCPSRVNRGNRTAGIGESRRLMAITWRPGPWAAKGYG